MNLSKNTLTMFDARPRLRWLSAAAASAIIGRVDAAPAQKYPRNLSKEDLDRWMTELSNWGRWGKDDQAGTVNLITPAKRHTFCMTVAPLRIPGATGSPFNRLAIF